MLLLLGGVLLSVVVFGVGIVGFFGDTIVVVVGYC